MPYYKPYKVVIIGFDGALSSALTGALDLFSFTGVSWQRYLNLPVEPRFDVQIASLHGSSFTCSKQLTIVPHASINEVETCDLLMVPTIGDSIDKVLNNSAPLFPHLRRLYKSGADVASNCSGAFLLAEASLLNGRKATTHWGYASRFIEDYPEVNLDEKQLVTQDDNIFCAAGGSAFYDLAMLLIERYCGREIANQVAKTQIVDSRKSNQSMYANLKLYKRHNDPLIQQVQEYVEENFSLHLSVNLLAEQANVTPRTLNRRFQKSVSMRPIEYIQAVRIEHSKRLLESGEFNIKGLSNHIGYEDVASFSRLFKRYTQLTPKDYQNKFKRS
ncbi:GlxA family transcriptional regulator [Glaciecola petra]|uniref:Helix-turn-helix domain-containing protein n=1 Tax=Glaciecola petra TaxID=3075602 RepID=A0ABU2ZPN6_9ALTE|nr:helix-turn-helix domain-containing protein [Aestuariibacter sp. P117]MDT0594365.1 helix-turn-helix domain-containing protein [Aestuariibacter sp. P117]